MTITLTLEHIRDLLPSRPSTAHKGTFGHLFVLAGSRGFTGAGRLVCEAANRSGVGLVTLGIPESLADVAACTLVEAMSLPLPGTTAESLALDALEPALLFAKDKSAVVLGPGLSRHAETTDLVHQFTRACPVPLLIDADGLNALSENLDTLSARVQAHTPWILTPHPGEMARLTNSDTKTIQNDRESVAIAFAKTYEVVLVLKGAGTLVAGPDGRCACNTTGNQGLASGGTGDVLSGIIGGLLAQNMPPFDAACIGVYLHGLAADLAIQGKSARSLIASDVIEAMPIAWHALEEGHINLL